MADFFQNGLITTLHDLQSGDAGRLEEMLVRWSEHRRLALVLPITASDLRAEPFGRIVKELEGVEFLHEIVVLLNKAPAVQDYVDCLRAVEPLGATAHVVWADGPRVTAVLDELRAGGISPGEPGKGRAVWTAYGYLLADPTIEAYALHDCDITTYTRELLVRLCWPVAHPTLDFRFVKAYYARFGDRLHGRAARLLVTPFVRAVTQCLGPDRFLSYLDSFRYPLSGEFSIMADLAAVNRVPADWGLEVGTLAEVYRNVSLKRVCQVDICPRYDHKHQPAALDDPHQGLLRMGSDIITSLLRTITAMGTTLHREHYVSIRAAYLRNAQDAIAQYAADAEMNGLILERHAEELLAESFAGLVLDAGERLERDPRHTAEIPNWARVLSAFPEVPAQLRAAVRADLHEHRPAR
jgi:glucosyl-3-phosphoglycerate synthase